MALAQRRKPLRCHGPGGMFPVPKLCSLCEEYRTPCSSIAVCVCACVSCASRQPQKNMADTDWVSKQLNLLLHPSSLLTERNKHDTLVNIRDALGRSGNRGTLTTSTETRTHTHTHVHIQTHTHTHAHKLSHKHHFPIHPLCLLAR